MTDETSLDDRFTHPIRRQPLLTLFSMLHRSRCTPLPLGGFQVLLSSHLGRPKDGPEDKFSLAPVSERLTKLLGKKVTMAPDCIGPEVCFYCAVHSSVGNTTQMVWCSLCLFRSAEWDRKYHSA